MFETPITVRGNVVDQPERRVTDSGVTMVSFRVASTQRRFNLEANEWVDGNQLFVRVTCWRETAENVALSVNKGDPILVFGRLFSRRYVKDEVTRLTYEVDADSVGHDLSRGVAKFDKRSKRLSGSVLVDADGLPERPDEGSYELVAEFGAGISGGAGVGGDDAAAEPPVAAEAFARAG